ncbi:MAG: pseudouridine synthase [Cyclobacteriaceae bacterium]
MNKKFNPRKKSSQSSPKKQEQKEEVKKDTVRLNRYISNSGVCSRRDADQLIADGKIKVNKEVVTEMGFQVKPGDKVYYQGKLLKREQLNYILLNKPKDYITTMEDPQGRKTVMELIKGAGSERIYPVGRLDRNTTGLLLFTNDGELAKKLSHPSYQIKKIYQVDLDKPITAEDLEAIREGVTLEDGIAEVDEVAILSKDKSILGLEIHIGKNRIVRRIFEHLGYEVIRLDRVMYGNLTKKDLTRGKWRKLDDKEVLMLKKFNQSKPAKSKRK